MPPPTPAPTGPKPLGDTTTTDGITRFMDEYGMHLIIGCVMILVIATTICAYKLRKDALEQVQRVRGAAG